MVCFIPIRIAIGIGIIQKNKARANTQLLQKHPISTGKLIPIVVWNFPISIGSKTISVEISRP
jgi:hypothetical protein